jgi:DMSO/TMAO reductase YedYZ molybdopterin-dependent catalytic subunit
MSANDDFRAKHGRRLKLVERRWLLRGGLSLGAVALYGGASLLHGGDLSDPDTRIDRTLWSMLRFNDRVQAALFNPNRLAATFTKAEITRPFKFNAYYPASRVRPVPADWKLEVGGLVDDDTPWTLDRLRRMPQESQITRHICVEGWSQIGEWSGVPLRHFLKAVGADTRARFVGFECFDDYTSSIDMASALHPQTILALDFEETPLNGLWGAPLRLRIPTKLGFKNPKYIAAITVTNDNPGGYWEDQGYNWFSGS